MRTLKYISWCDTTGYAIAAKSYVRALVDVGVDLTWSPLLTGQGDDEVYVATSFPCPTLGPVCNRDIDYDTVLIHTIPEHYPEWIERERRPGRRILGYTVWELELLPKHWPAILNQLDGVIVPCRSNVEVFRNSGVTVPIHVVPHLSQFENMGPVTDADRTSIHARMGKFAADHERFIFLHVGFWSNRKAPYLAVEAYLRAFDASDRVLMVVKTSSKDITSWHRHWRNGFRLRHPSSQQSVKALLSCHPGRAPVVVIADDFLSDPQMLALYEMGDCFVSLTRTEGWGLGAFEAARLGTPVVMTGYGGQLDYLAPDLSWLVDYEMVPVYEPIWSANYKPGDRWASPSVSHAATQLREIYDNQMAARSRAQHLADRIAVNFSTKATITSLLAALS